MSPCQSPVSFLFRQSLSCVRSILLRFLCLVMSDLSHRCSHLSPFLSLSCLCLPLFLVWFICVSPVEFLHIPGSMFLLTGLYSLCFTVSDLYVSCFESQAFCSFCIIFAAFPSFYFKFLSCSAFVCILFPTVNKTLSQLLTHQCLHMSAPAPMTKVKRKQKRFL